MVRRKAQGFTGPQMPAWVREFVPADWAGSSEQHRYVAWSRAVRSYCRSMNLAALDFEAWLSVIGNIQATRRQRERGNS